MSGSSYCVLLESGAPEPVRPRQYRLEFGLSTAPSPNRVRRSVSVSSIIVVGRNQKCTVPKVGVAGVAAGRRHGVRSVGQRTWILVGILSGRAKRIERDSLDTAAKQEHAPPPGNELKSGLEMVWTNY